MASQQCIATLCMEIKFGTITFLQGGWICDYTMMQLISLWLPDSCTGQASRYDLLLSFIYFFFNHVIFEVTQLIVTKLSNV